MENLPATNQQKAVAEHRSFFAMEPTQQVAYASQIATVLADVINKQNLYSNIGGKNYVKVEGWQTLGTFLGIIPKERTVNRLSDGSYEAFVDLIKFSDGTVVGGGSALCSVTEKRWGNADEYARRSMAITRATGKAFRSAFSWIVTLAGYEPTPEEEIPQGASVASGPKQVSPKGDMSSEPKFETYTGTNAQQEAIKARCVKDKIDKKYWPPLHEALMFKTLTPASIDAAIREVTKQ